MGCDLLRDKNMENRFLPKGKKGSKYLSPWLFLNWLIIGVVIVIGILIFYSLSIDVREEESNILTWKILDCFSDEGYFNDNVLEEDFDIYSECGLSKAVLDESEKYYIDILILQELFLDDGSPMGTRIEYFEIGKRDLSMQYKLGSTVSEDNEKYPKCDEDNLRLSTKLGNGVEIDIFICSNQEGARL